MTMEMDAKKRVSEWTNLAEPEANASGASDLLLEIAKGSLSAFETLYDSHSGLLYAICKRILKHEQESRDVLSEVFFEVWQKAYRFDPGRGSADSFLFSIARTRAIDRLRRIHGRNYQSKMPESVSDLDHAPVSISLRPIQRMVIDEENGLIHNALGELEPMQRRLVEAAYFDGLSHSQISSQFSIPLGTVKTSIRRAILSLRQLLRNDQAWGDCK